MYLFADIEKKWQKYWLDKGIFKFIDDPNKEKFYILDMFPYPSGSGLHVGHVKGYLASDVLAKYKRMKGFCVLHPIGWDAFGLPAEQFSIKHNKNPHIFTLENIEKFRQQLKSLSFSYDFDLEINTSDPEYFKQTQLIFQQFIKHNLAELKWTSVKWCPELSTVLSNEEILNIDGKMISERGNYPVVNLKLKQWILKITNYADRLLEDIQLINWSQGIKDIQINWIGKAKKYIYKLKIKDEIYDFYLNNPNDINNLNGIFIHDFSEVEKNLVNSYAEVIISNQKKLSILIYWLNDCDFRSTKFIPKLSNETNNNITEISDKWIFTYKLKDWIFSRQRYWGEPIPVYYSKTDEKMYLDENLPVLLPAWGDKSKYDEWLNMNDSLFIRDKNTMPNWAGSSWYFIAYLMKQKDEKYWNISSKEVFEKLKRWMPVDVYIGGQEHANLHLLYARFWYKFLYDIGIVPNKEPFQKLINQGMILGSDGTKMSKSKNNSININDVLSEYGSDVLRMNMAFLGPTEATQKWETFQMPSLSNWLKKIFILFTEELNTWVRVDEFNKQLNEKIYNLLQKVIYSIEKLRLNVIVSELMIFINNLQKLKQYNSNSSEVFLIVLSLLAPCLAEELWFKALNKKESIFLSSWPDENLFKPTENKKKYVIQINGIFKSLFYLTGDLSEKEIFQKIKEDKKIKKYLENKKIIKYFFINSLVVNILVDNEV